MSMMASPMRVVINALTAGRQRRRLLVPEADQQVAAQPHDLPEDEEGQQNLRRPNPTYPWQRG